MSNSNRAAANATARKRGLSLIGMVAASLMAPVLFWPLPTPPQGRPMSKSQEYRVMVMQKALGGAGVLAPGINSWTAAAEVLAHLDALASVGHALAAVPAHTPGALDEPEIEHRIREWLGPQRISLHTNRDIEMMARGVTIWLAIEAASPSEETR